jgi:hypothetical protein
VPGFRDILGLPCIAVQDVKLYGEKGETEWTRLPAVQNSFERGRVGSLTSCWPAAGRRFSEARLGAALLG